MCDWVSYWSSKHNWRLRDSAKWAQLMSAGPGSALLQEVVHECPHKGRPWWMDRVGGRQLNRELQLCSFINFSWTALATCAAALTTSSTYAKCTSPHAREERCGELVFDFYNSIRVIWTNSIWWGSFPKFSVWPKNGQRERNEIAGTSLLGNLNHCTYILSLLPK